MKHLIPFFIPLALMTNACSNVTFHSESEIEECAIGEFSKEDLLRIKQSGFEGITNEELNSFALDLLPCVGAEDPEMRDGIVYESLSYLLRNDKINDDTKTELVVSLIASLNGEDDEQGFLKPFAALDLSELARADRIESYLGPEKRTALIMTTIGYLNSIDDYRGYNDQEGWRHGVAHAADVAMQLSLNENVNVERLTQLRMSLAKQIAPEGHAYIHGESERLARPVLYMAQRGVFTQGNWDQWFLDLTDPSPFEAWDGVFKSESGLAKLHNTKAFLNAVYVNASVTKNENMKMLETSSFNALKQLP